LKGDKDEVFTVKSTYNVLKGGFNRWK